MFSTAMATSLLEGKPGAANGSNITVGVSGLLLPKNPDVKLTNAHAWQSGEGCALVTTTNLRGTAILSLRVDLNPEPIVRRATLTMKRTLTPTLLVESPVVSVIVPRFAVSTNVIPRKAEKGLGAQRVVDIILA